MTKFYSLARARVIGPEGGAWCGGASGGVGEGAAGVDVLVVSSSESFATNAPDPPHWTLNSCFGAFHSFWVHFGSFGCLTKLGAKGAQVVQKFVPRSRVGIFRNECTRSTL